MIDALIQLIFLNTPLLFICLSAIKPHVGHTAIEFNTVYFFGFAQTTIHDFQNTRLNSKWNCQMTQK